MFGYMTDLKTVDMKKRKEVEAEGMVFEHFLIQEMCLY